MDAKTRRSSLDPKKLLNYLGKMEGLHGQLDKLRSEHMLACKDVRADIKQVLKDAKADGILPKALKGKVKLRELDRKKDEVVNALDIDEQSQLELFEDALGA